MPNRQQRRRAKVDDLLRADVNLRNLTPSVFAPIRHGTWSFSVIAKNDFELWTQVVVGTMQNLGITQGQWAIGWFLDFLNQQPVEFRKMMAAGILQGLGMTVIQKPGSEGELVLEVQFDPKYERLIPAEPGMRPGGKLWVPGDSPEPSVIH